METFDSLLKVDFGKANAILSSYHSTIPDGSQWHAAGSFDECQWLLRCYRFKRKFYVPEIVNDRALDWVARKDFSERMQSFNEFRFSETYFRDCFRAYLWGKDSRLRSVKVGELITKVRCLLLSWTRDYKPRYTDSLFGPGETSDGLSGWTTPLAKYTHGRYPCPARALPYLRRVFIRDPILRRRAKLAGLKLRSTGQSEYQVANSALFDLGFAFLTQYSGQSECEVTTVEKDNDGRRVIAKPLLALQIAESPIASGIESILEQHGCFLRNDASGRDGQYYHKQLIVNDVATVDFSKASDSNLISFLRVVLNGTSLLNDVEKVRPVWYQNGSEKAISPIVAPMGFKICFLLMTLVLAAIACVLTGRRVIDRRDPASPQVYGDDVIIENSIASEFIRKCEMIGYSPNRKKSFVNSAARESCGAYVFKSTHLLSYDIKPITNPAEYVATLNKLLMYHLGSSGDEAEYWLGIWRELRSLARDVPGGPLPSSVEEDLEAYIYDFEPKSHQVTLLDWLSKRLQIKLLCVETVKFENAAYEGHRRPLQSRAYQLLRIRDRLEPTIQRRFIGEWKPSRLVVAEDGRVIGDLRSLKRERAREANNLAVAQLQSYLLALRAVNTAPEYWLRNLTEYYRFVDH